MLDAGLLYGDLLGFIATKAAGKDLDDNFQQGDQEKALACLEAVHSAGVVHGDVFFNKFVRHQNGRVWLVNFASSSGKWRGTRAALEAEKKQLQQLLAERQPSNV